MQSMIPKREIGALQFLKNNPEYDGRGVVIAIWDTGVDPTAPGLQITSQGEPKIIDLIDASGSGDVNMLTSIRITDSSRTVTTLTGRVVSIPRHWKPVDGLIRVGVKSAAEIFPAALLAQLRAEATDRYWRPTVQRLCDYLKEAADSPSAHTVSLSYSVIGEAPNADYKPEGVQTDRTGASSATSFVSCKEEVEEQRRDQAEVGEEGKSGLKAPLIRPEAAPNFAAFREWLDFVDKTKDPTAIKSMERILATLNEQQEYFAPVFDCFVFKGEDGDFVACVDISPYEETPTTLADMPLLKDFSIGRQVAHFGNDTLLYFTVKILNDGDLLQVVTNCGSHGTHVAAIAAAYFPPSENCDDDEGSKALNLPEEVNQNGVAPGAQIVSIKIADTHLLGMETNTSLLCALNWTTKLKCDIVNYSFGEKAFLPNFGRIYTHLTQFVMHTNVAFVTSGGNGGPALGTVGSPGGAVDGLIGVAPLLFPKMMEYMYCQPTWNNGCSCTKSYDDALDQSDTVADTPTTSNDATESTDLVPSAYTWGSRGPSLDGDLGLTVAACGAAVADVAAWKCSAFDLLNGSSMSSPSVAGGFALVLSALRQSELQPCLRVPFNLWRAAIFACAKPLAHLSPLEQGAGLFQVGATYEFLRDIIRPKPTPSAPVSRVNQVESVRAQETTSAPPAGGSAQLNQFSGWWLSCHVSGPGCIVENSRGLHNRGIWLRRGWLPFSHHCDGDFQSVPSKMSYTVHLEPRFCNTISAEFRRNFSLNLSVQVGYQPSNTGNDVQRPNWLHIAPFVMLASRSRTLPLFIDPAAFEMTSTGDVEFNPPSRVYHTCVAFVNANSPQHEVLALLPITIQLPAVTQFDVFNGVHSFGLCGDFSYTQKVCRWFVRIPRGSTAGVLRLRRVDSDGDIPCSFTISVVQPAPLGGAQGTGYEVVHRRVNLVSRTAGGVGLTGRNDPPSSYESASADFVFAFAVEWVCDCVEITVAQHHGCDTPTVCRISGRLDFHGLEVRPEKLVFHSSQTYFPISLRSNFGLENIKFDVESKYWIQPVRPASSSRCYRKLLAYEKGSLGLPGLHSLSLVYNFFCHFKTDSAVFDFRRLTSLLYEADVVQVVYHVYDGCGRFKGAGSYQSISNPKYRFKLTKGPHQLIATILYADTKKVSYTAKDSDALDKLAHYPLLVRWPLVTSNIASISNTSNSTSTEGSTSCQIVLEVSTSLATLALTDVDYERTCARFVQNSSGGCDDETVGENRGGGGNRDADLKSPKKDPIFGNLQKFPTVPGHLAAGECATEVFGVVEENFAPYAISGSYFEGRMAYYDNRDLKNIVKLPLEIHVGPRDSGGATTSTPPKPPAVRGVFGLRARDVWLLRWIANPHFGLKNTPNRWVTPYETNSLSKVGSPKERKKKNGGSISNGTSGSSNKTKEGGTNASHHVTALLKAGSDATSTDRAAVWKAVNTAMTDLIAAVGAVNTDGPDEHLNYLRPSPFFGIENDDDGGIGSIPLLSTPTAAAESATEEPKPVSEAKEGEPTLKPSEKSITRVQVVEVLSVYGRHLCEQITLQKRSNRALAALDLVIIRLQHLLGPSSPKDASTGLMKNYFDGEDAKVASSVGMSVAEVERVKPLFNAFWLAHLFVLHPQLPLLDALIRLAFQLGSSTGRGGPSPTSTLSAKHPDLTSEKVVMDCASIAFPWMVEQLKRMGLGSLARQLERQMPSRFSAFDYTLATPCPPAIALRSHNVCEDA